MAGERIKELIEIFNNLKDIVPVILEIVECVKQLDPAQRQKIASIIANRVIDDEEKRSEFVQRIVKLGD